MGVGDDGPETTSAEGFETNVFVNCPFDASYKPLLKALLFTISHLGFSPRIASERLDSGENRIDKICQLIRASKYSIHDLSRLRVEGERRFSRLNMSFEYGIDYGARQYGSASLQSKRCLVLETNPYDYQKALSDISGIDIKNHGDKPDELVRAVRDWPYEAGGRGDADYPTVIWNRFNDFLTDLRESRLAEGIPVPDVIEDIERMPVVEYLDAVETWVSENA